MKLDEFLFTSKSSEWPIWCLAPMEGVTDTVFRQLIARWGKPDVFFTEFTSVDGLFSKGEEFVGQRLQYTEKERPLVAQIWGLKPEYFRKGAEYLVVRGFDGIDINMGCPDKRVIAKGAGGALVCNPDLAIEMIRAVKEGSEGKVPVSVKIRIGFNSVVTEDWVSRLLAEEIQALTIHGRTVKQLSRVPANWEEIGKAVKVRDEMGVKTKIIGNGDVNSLELAQEKVDRYGVDGVMIGRGIFEDPLVFNKEKSFGDLSVRERLRLLEEHAKLFVETWGDKKPFEVLRKYFKIYVKGFGGAKELRIKLMGAANYEEVERILEEWVVR